MKKLLILSALILSAGSLAARADLLGSTVSGTYTVNGNTVALTPSSATIDTGTEFTFVAAGTPRYQFTIDFSGTGVTIADTCTAAPRLCGQGAVDFTFAFTDSAFANTTLSETSTTAFITSFGRTGNTLSFTGPVATGGSSTFAITPNVAATPEPGSLFLLGTGLLGAFGVAAPEARCITSFSHCSQRSATMADLCSSALQKLQTC